MLELPYPGGPEISKLAKEERGKITNSGQELKFPRPMINSKDYDFSFSGLKTAVLYTIRASKKKIQKF
jgi:N6-L-threonylcarbamoyladenine synthase